MNDKTNKTIKKKRKARLAVLEGNYEHTETRTQAILRLEASIKATTEKLLQITKNEPKIVKRHGGARSQYQIILNFLDGMNDAFQKIDIEIEKARNLGDLQHVVELLTEKEEKVGVLSKNIAGHREKLEQFEQEAYPEKIIRSQYADIINNIIDSIATIHKKYDLKEP